MIDLKQKMGILKERIALLNYCEPESENELANLEQKYIINKGEVPWWEIQNREERNRMCHRQGMRMWNKNHPGVSTKRTKAWYEERPGALAEYARNWNTKHPGRALEVSAKYSKTPKGRARNSKRNATRRERSTNPEAYASRVFFLHTHHESCLICNTLYKETHQIDHIIALSLGGTDDWENLQPICLMCHNKKSAYEMGLRNKISGNNRGV